MQEKAVSACRDNLYPGVCFYNYDKFATENYPSGKKCDILFFHTRGVVLLELKALNWFFGLTPTAQTLDEELKKLQKILIGKFENSAHTLVANKIVYPAKFPYYVVVFSKEILRRKNWKAVNLVWLKYYVQNRLFPLSYTISFNHRKTKVLVRECTKLGDVWQNT